MTSTNPAALGGVPKGPPPHAPNAALLIDFDNVTMGIRSDLQTELRRLLASDIIRGKVAVQRAYADWRRYPQYIVPLSESSIDLIFAPAFGSNKKNATDIRLAIDALELIFTRPEIGTFILLSGDSDFSSLVLKLKEYGKYVIGVGIRDSSSDLLIQNCDEYYSYNELTGLTKTTDIEVVRRDPWELVVAAIARMQQDKDVMRSDRLKQVMLEIDPNFNEKDAGFSRFSKFVVEAKQRGLVQTRKRENGQYDVAPGPQANIERFLQGTEAPPQPRVEARAEAPSGERRRGRGARAATPGPSPAERGLSLAEAFDLMRSALTELGGAPVAADAVRDRMLDLHDDADDPVLTPPRFTKLLRQAHDASVIDLEKLPDGSYEVTFKPRVEEAPAEEAPEAADARPRGRRRGARGRKPRQREGAPRAEDREPRQAVRQAVPVAEDASAERPKRRNPRFRRGSRGRSQPVAGPLPGPVGEGVPDTPGAKPAIPAPAANEAASRREWGRRPRLGARSSPAAPNRAGSAPTPAPSGGAAAAPSAEPTPGAGGSVGAEGSESFWARLSRGLGLRPPSGG